MRKRVPSVWVATVIIGILGTACHTAQTAYRAGKYEKSIEAAVRKLRRDRTDEKTIVYLEAAYDKLYHQKMRQIEFWKKEGLPENVLAIYDELDELRYYQNLISPLLPLYIPSKKRQASFKWVSDADYLAARNRAAEYLYARAKGLLGTGYREDARQAHGLLVELQEIYPNYQDVEQLLRQALALGTNRVLIYAVNNSGAPLFAELEKHITTMPVGDLNRAWVSFTNVYDPSEQYDYRIVLNIRELAVSPDLQLPPRIYTESKQVQDGWEFVTDAQGNPIQDSTGAYVKKPRYKTISCIVSEYVQQKFATIGGYVEFYRGSDHALLYSYPINIHKIFEHYWATANGDLAALSAESLAKVKIGPAVYPSELSMLLQAADELKYLTRNIVLQHIHMLRQ
ncbi:MAG: hypothetical protein NZL95_08590 [Chitinophagales bacterium]|nr:hypothetical protein [Chitinophagales bacterium]MDW8428594.1 hypothetical protein [Chitinophagales bacterium]